MQQTSCFYVGSSSVLSQFSTSGYFLRTTLIDRIIEGTHGNQMKHKLLLYIFTPVEFADVLLWSWKSTQTGESETFSNSSSSQAASSSMRLKSPSRAGDKAADSQVNCV
ncbi:hypothetical protein V6N12_005165 [Hibiscus sabdariffa]|uniref:Uncharacterized protein n=1 Tax=Hibiscus sabdariffa TaxID=183260 RepID=A0ABR2CPC7_9ROSI